MTKPLDIEVKALYAIHRALQTLDPEAQERALAYFYARIHNTTQDKVRAGLRLAQARSA